MKANHSDQLGDLADSPMMDKAESMEGALRNVSTHAAGIIISSDKLYGNIPLFKDHIKALNGKYEFLFGDDFSSDQTLIEINKIKSESLKTKYYVIFH